MITTIRRVCMSACQAAACAVVLFAGEHLSAALPAGWSSTDIGTVAVAGTADHDSVTDVYTVEGSGSGDISGSSDHFHYAHRALSGDGYIVARIDSLTNTNGWAKAGVMIRESLDANSRHALMMVTPSNGTGIKWRSATGGSSSQIMVSGAAPRWLKLERRGKMLTGFESSDGVNWNVVQRVAVAMGTDVYAGLVACSRTSGLTTVSADGVEVGALSTELALPWPWDESTVGTPSDAGVALYDGSYVLSNLGADITGTADRFKFVSQTLTGNGTLTMRVSSVVSSDNSSRFGLMFRESQDANARHVMLGVTTSKALFFSSRRTTGGNTTSVQSSVTVTVPAWIRLERDGNVFKAYTSADGATWSLHGTETLALGVTLHVGVAYSNRHSSTWAIGVGDDLGLVTPLDTDGNGLSDDWETNFFSATGVDPSADPDGDGLTNAQEWELGNNPLVFNLEGQRPLLELVGGDNQTGVAGTQLPLPLAVRVKDSLSDDPVANIPVQFRVLQGEGTLGATLPGDPVLNLSSDTEGLVQSAFQLPATGGDQIVGVGVGGRQQASVVVFTLKSLVGAAPGLFDVTNLGQPALPGRVTYSEGEYTLQGATTSAFTGGADTGTYAWRDFTGDGFILARVDHVDATDNAAQAGVMIRESLDANSRYVSMLLTEANGVVFQWRETVGGSTKTSYQSGVTGPVWLLLRRSGDTYTAFYSADGQTWTLKSTRTQAMGSTVKIGLAHGTRTSIYTSATVDGLRLGEFAETPWQGSDIGLPRATAVNDFTEDGVLMRAGGTNIGGTADTFHFLHQPLAGDGRLIVRLADQQSTHTGADSGIMIRESLDQKARHVSLLLSPATGLTLVNRVYTNGSTSTFGTTNPAAEAPQWLRLDRIGGNIHGYTSADGESWTLLGSKSFAFAGPALIGLAGGNYDHTAHSLVDFDHLQLDLGDGPLGWNGAYYDGGNFDQLKLDRRDTELDFTWPVGVAPTSGVSADSYSIRWQGDVVPATTASHTFTLLSQGSARVTVNGQVLINRWSAHTLGEASGSISLQAGEPARVVVEYANTPEIDARVQLRWSAAGLSDEVVPFGSVQPIDRDDDGLPDAWEITHGLDPDDAADGALDPDGDGLSNRMEYEFGGNPFLVDDRLSGVVTVESWTVAGEVVRNLTSLDRFVASNPNSKTFATELRFPTNGQNGYGRRVRGYIVPPATGDYRFYVAANDTAEFWLSPDDNPFARVKRARVGKALTDDQNYWDRVEQRSVVLTLQAGEPHYFELLHKQNSGVSHATVAWTGPGMSEPQVITGAALESYAPVVGDQDDDGLPDAWQATHGLDDLNLPSASRGAYGDADGDRLPNLLEYQHGLDPQAADTDGDTHEDALEVFVSADPLDINTDVGLTPWQLGDVGATITPALANRVDTDAFRLAGTGTGLAIHKSDSFRYLYHEVTGDFELTTRMVRPADNVVGLGGVSIRSSLDDHAVSLSLLQDTEGYNRGYYRVVEDGPIMELPAFTPAFASEAAGLAGYWFRIRRTGDLVRLYCSVDGDQWLLAYAKVLPLGEDCLVGFATASNMGPYTSYSDIDLPAREFADITLDLDYADPEALDTIPEDATVTPVATIGGGDGVTVKGQWAVDADGIVSQTFTGTLDYAFTVPADGLYRLTFLANSPSNPTGNTLFPLQISIDGQVIGRVDLFMEVGQDGLARIVTPWLLAGAHTVRVFYDNTLSYHPLRIRSLTVEALGGVDADSDGVADWIEGRLAALNTIDTDNGLYVSPASLHGQSRYRSMFTLTADTQPVQTQPAPGYGWYADVALSETAPVEIVGDFENGGSVQGVFLNWIPLNLLDLPVEYASAATMRVRLGDSLRLTAHPTGATGGTADITVTLSGETPVTLALTDPVGQPIAHAFEEPGVYTVTATYTDAASNQTVADAFTVEVIEAAFAADPTVGLNNYPVIWDNPLIPNSVLLEVDQGVLLVAQGGLPAGGTSYSVTSGNVDDSYVVARLGEDGPIFGHATIHTVRTATLPDTAMDTLQVYPDGSRLIGVPIVLNHITDDTRVEVEIFVQGVTFEDGTIVKVLTNSDFDEYGRVYLKFIYPTGVDGSICHRVHVYEGSAYLGTF